MSEYVRIARHLYQDGPYLLRNLQHWRPYICPYENLIQQVPPESRVLDIGCGAGLFLGILAASHRISGGVGFDASSKSISLAHTMTNSLPTLHGVEFFHLNAKDKWPQGEFNLVSLIDVMHHVSPHEQQNVFMQAAGQLSPGDKFLYKDIANRPQWKATANRLHDLLVVQEVIHYVACDQILEWAEESQLVLKVHQEIDMLWYRHELLVFERPD